MLRRRSALSATERASSGAFPVINRRAMRPFSAGFDERLKNGLSGRAARELEVAVRTVEDLHIGQYCVSS
jgi:hypothetical protein